MFGTMEYPGIYGILVLVILTGMMAYLESLICYHASTGIVFICLYLFYTGVLRACTDLM